MRTLQTQFKNCLVESWRLRTVHPLVTAACFSSSASRPAASKGQKRKPRDPYAVAQARQRKAANLARRAVLKQEREAAMGDPVLGTETPFIRSLNRMVSRSARVLQKATSAALKPPAKGATFSSVAPSDPAARQGKPEIVLSYGVRPSEFEEAAKRARLLTQPLPGPFGEMPEAELKERNAEHENATTAMARIISLANGHFTDRRRLVRQQCVEKFGRHRTDQHLEPKPPADVPRDPSLPPPPQKTPRAGPDTGSPEVQIAILTMRIRSLVSHLSGKGRTDKMNKRNLRLLVHKRQKLLKYLRRQDRGASRWQHVMGTLGLTERMWNGEISLA